MNKLFKLLNKHNNNYLMKQKSNKKSVKAYDENFKKQGINLKVKDDFDFLEFSILRTSYDNMTKIQTSFFEIKESLRELWNVITYQEKHFLLYQELNPVMDSLKSFEIHEKRHFIVYFDSLINAYYDHDMLMFENPSYQKYLYDFSTLITDSNQYGIIPIQCGFADVDYIVGTDEDYVMYNRAMRRFYHIKDSQKLTVGVVRDLKDEEIDTIAKMIKNNEEQNLINYLIEHEVTNKKLMKKLLKKQRKF